MRKEQIYLSTIASDAVRVAKEYGVNLEIAEYCTAWNMDEKFSDIDPVVRKKLTHSPRSLLHAPYNELFPCAIDKKARALAAERYRHAIALAKGYGSEKVIIHGGYQPMMYFPVWYTEQSILFWKEFLKEEPGVELVLENVLEEEPDWVLDIIKGVDDPQTPNVPGHRSCECLFGYPRHGLAGAVCSLDRPFPYPQQRRNTGSAQCPL